MGEDHRGMHGQPEDLPEPIIVARTAAEFVKELNRLRRWAGEPSYRKLSRHTQAGPGIYLSPSTIHSALGRDGLPRLAFVESFVAACLQERNVDEAEPVVEKWRAAWRSIDGEAAPAAPAAPEPRPSFPVPAGLRRWLLPIATFVVGCLLGGVTVWLLTPQTPAAATPNTIRAQKGTPDRTVDRKNCQDSWQFQFGQHIGEFTCTTIYIFVYPDGREVAFGIGVNHQVYFSRHEKPGDTVSSVWQTLGGYAMKGISLHDPKNRTTPTPTFTDQNGVQRCAEKLNGSQTVWERC